MIYYNQSDLEPLKDGKKKSIILMIASVTIAAIIDTVLMFFTNEYNVKLMEFIASIVFIAGVWYALGTLFMSVLTKRTRIKHIESILNNPKKQLDGEIIEIRNPLTLSNGIFAYEITLSKNKIKHTLYYENALGDPSFKIGDYVKCDVSTSNFIYSLEAMENGSV